MSKSYANILIDSSVKDRLDAFKKDHKMPSNGAAIGFLLDEYEHNEETFRALGITVGQ